MPPNQAIPKPKFELGRILVTPGILEAFRDSNQSFSEFLLRHEIGDWGDICDEDRAANEAAIAHEGDVNMQLRVLSVYVTNAKIRFWIITEYDRSITTILLPEDY